MNRAEAGRAAQRSGDNFENSIEAENRGYQMRGKALVDRLRLTGRFVKGKGFVPGQSPVDFVGSIKVRGAITTYFMPCCFDAKSFAGDRWSFAEWQPTAKKHHQLKRLREMAAFGGVAFVLVQCSQPRQTTPRDMFLPPAWLVPLAVVEHFINLGQWSFSAEFMDSAVAVQKIRGADWYSSAANLLLKSGV